jgi:hypothetical protein
MEGKVCSRCGEWKVIGKYYKVKLSKDGYSAICGDCIPIMKSKLTITNLIDIFKLKIELIPRTAWYKNLRSELKKSDWDKIRKSVYAKQNMHCHICGDQCMSLDAHEIWDFDEENHIQRLVDIIGICKPCHNTIHYGRAQIIGQERAAREQFIKVNDCDYDDLQDEIRRAKEDFDRRSEIKDWKLDVSFIEEQGYVLNKH